MKIGIDLGGTKIAAVVLSDAGEETWASRVPTPQQDYEATVRAVRDIALEAEKAAGETCTVGMGIPGSIVRSTGLAQNANSTWLNDKPFGRDLCDAMEREVRIANDANCLALSEWVDGAASEARSVFGVIIGTGCGGGLVFDGRIIDGPLGIGGEWGHIPLPWPEPNEVPGPLCWCKRRGCMERWVSGTAMERDHKDRTGQALKGAEIFARRDEDPDCAETLDLHLSRLARGLAVVVDIFDPEVIVLGGGLSNMKHLYEGLPEAIKPHIFTSLPFVDIRPPKYGDASGVRGAAWLWGTPSRPA